MFVVALLLCMLTVIYPPWRVSSKHEVAARDEMGLSTPDNRRASDETEKTTASDVRP